MFFEILLFYSYQVTIFFSISAYGFYFSNKILNVHHNFFSLYILLGIIFLSFFVTFLHFFISITIIVNFCIYTFGLIIFYLCKEQIFKIINFKILLFIFLLSIVVGFGYKPNEDFYTYHLPYIINFTNEKVIFGLSHIQANQGWNSMWLNFSSLFYLPILEIKSINIANVILFKTIVLFMFENIKNKKFDNSFYFLIILSCYLIIKFARLNTFGFDVPSNFVLILSFFFLLNINKENSYENNQIYFSLATIFGLFSSLIRISNSIIVFAIFLIFIFYKFKIFSKVNIFCFLFLGIFFVQQTIYTGCFLYPIYDTCFETLPWADIEYAEKFSSGTNHANKSFSSYNGDLTPQEYVQNFNWVNTWWFRNKIEFTEHLIAFFIPILLISFTMPKLKINKTFNSTLILNCILILTSLASIIIWFTQQPVIRYGIVNFFIFLTLIFLLIFYRYREFTKISKNLIYIIALVIFFCFSKNLLRINKNNYNFYYNHDSFKYKSVQILNKLTINLSENLWCGDVPFLCLTKDVDVKLDRIFKNYIIVNKNDSKFQ